MSNQWNCNICKASFHSAASTWFHYNHEHVEHKYICTLCSEEFRQKSSFEDHWVDDHKRDPYDKYRYLERKIELYDSRNGPLKKLLTYGKREFERPKQNYAANVKKYRGSDENSRHAEYKDYMQLRKRLQSGEFRCPICDNALSNRQTLIYHMGALHPEHKLPGYLQPRTCLFASRLISKFKAKLCYMCSRDYPSYENLKSHLQNRHEIDIRICSYAMCTRAFLHQEDLQKHKMSDHLKSNR